MGRISDFFASLAASFVDRFTGSGLSQAETSASGSKEPFPGMPELLRRAAAESCVLLKNDGALPLKRDERVSVFGRCQKDWFFVGNGSGGDVHPPYAVSLLDAMLEADDAGMAKLDRPLAETYISWTADKKNAARRGWWGHWPFSHPEMPLTEEQVSDAAKRSDAAVVVLGRSSGEDRDLVLEPGSYFLSAEEERMLRLVTSHFRKTAVLLNCGNLPDLSWTASFGDRLSAVLVCWMGGMESGRGAFDVLYGNVCPCGKLPCTAAKAYDHYPGRFGHPDETDYGEDIFIGYRHFDRHPEQVLYPFGFGLSYTTFHTEVISSRFGEVTVRVTNTGAAAGKETAALWCAQPEGRLPKAVRVLADFAKTGLLDPGKSEDLVLTFDSMTVSSYSEDLHAYILEKGDYRLEVNGVPAGGWTEDSDRTVRVCEPLLGPSSMLRERILSGLPAEEKTAPEEKKDFSEISPDDGEGLSAFVSSLSDGELEALTRGHGMMNSPLGIPGNAGVFGGILPSLRDRGIPPVSCCDGPAGVRAAAFCSLLPCGTALASTWDRNLVREIYALLGKEMEKLGADVLLAPGMNLHRNPLCGRNFEYFSEDPVLSGRTAAAVVSGLQSSGRGACPKHYACNHQEFRRNRHNAKIGERALRELYLRNFEICIRESAPMAVMTAYNKVNGVWCHYHYDLVTTVLRKEFGYRGMVMTDWWMRKASSPEFPSLRNNAYRIRAQVDLLMPGSFLHTARSFRKDRHVASVLEKAEGLTRAELRRSAVNVLRAAAWISANRRAEGEPTSGVR